ncbi:MAG: bifunctional riboflavin kinase/FAD synthetase [Pseudomonadota bacterium]
MELICEIDNIANPLVASAVTVGNFDGVHLGHKALIEKTILKAHDIGGKSIAITFNPHPLKILAPQKCPLLITTNERKAELIAQTGVDALISVRFTPEFASIPAESFIKDILCAKLGMKAIIVGPDYTFGANREGSIETLNKIKKSTGLEVTVLPWVGNARERISSTRIRNLILDGKVAEANRLLGRHYELTGVVVSGRNRGARLLGFPTANLSISNELCPKAGVYAALAQHCGKTYKAVANIGYSPTFADGALTIEAHLLDFADSLYGEMIRIDIVKRLRGEKKFPSHKELAVQIRKDIMTAREAL